MSSWPPLSGFVPTQPGGIVGQGPPGPAGPIGPAGPPGPGSVTSVTAGTGLTASTNPITTTGTLSLTSPIAASFMPAYTGDVTSPAGSAINTLATVNANVGTFQGITVNAKGLVTAAANQSYLTGNQTITLSGDVAGSGSTAITTTLATVNSNLGTFQGLTVNGKGLVTAAANMNYAPLASPTFTGTPAGPTAALNTNTTQLATTAFVIGQASTSNPLMNGTVAIGTGTTWARADHVHPTDTSRGTVNSITAGTGLSGGTITTSGTISLTTPVVVANGGTGATNLPLVVNAATYSLLLGNGTSAVQVSPNWGSFGDAGIAGYASGSAPYIQFMRTDGTLSVPTAVLSGETLGSLLFGGNSGPAWSPSGALAGIRAQAAENFTTAAQGNRFTFSTTTPGTVTAAERMRLGQGLMVGTTTDNGAGTINASSSLTALGVITRPGTAGATSGHNYNIDWTSTAQLWIDNVNAGTFAFTSDYRIKTDVVELPSMWGQVKALRPVSYRRKNYEPRTEAVGSPLIEADPAERWGFIAHELQEALLDSAATGYKDAPNLIQSPDPLTLIAVLAKGLQEAMARIEALEQRR